MVQSRQELRQSIRTIPHFPKQGIMFRDITTLLENPAALAYTIQELEAKYRETKIDKIVAIESRGFIFGSLLAQRLQVPLVLLRKKGKLPGPTVSQDYELEYGTDTLELHKDSIVANDSVLIVDDLLATGGTAFAAATLVEKIGASVCGVSCIINLPELGGSKKIKQYNPYWLVEFEGH